MNATIALTLFLLSLMIGAGVISASWGYTLGREALKGITQPDTRPGSTLGDTQNSPSHRREELVLLKEEEILKQVKARINQETASPGEQPQSKASPEASPSLSPVEVTASVQDQDVNFQVTNVRQEGDSLVLDVSLQNNGSTPVRFLYSFLTITDNQGRTLDGSTDGLPGELLPNGEAVSGVVRIPVALLDGVGRLSLSLTDYPNQSLKLEVADIPVSLSN
jgi:hypothetical protein